MIINIPTTIQQQQNSNRNIILSESNVFQMITHLQIY